MGIDRRSPLRRRRYRRLVQELDLFRGLGPGDPGYRLRPGASGLDPMESYMEQGRVIGLIIKSIWDKRSPESLLASLGILFAGTLFITARLHSSLGTHAGVHPYFALAVPTVVLSLALSLLLLNSREERARS
jgi:hypothetical protein